MENKFKIGDSVKVKKGTSDPDFDFDIGGWQGRITELEEPEPGDDLEMLVTLEWDSITLKNYPEEYILQSIEEELDYTLMVLDITDLESAEPRDTETDVEKAVDDLEEKYTWANLGEAGERIAKVLKGVDVDDTWGAYNLWNDYLSKKLTFPFMTVVAEFQETGSVQTGDEIKVNSIAEIVDLYGILVKGKCKSNIVEFPLCDLDVLDEDSDNFEPVADYCIWFANR